MTATRPRRPRLLPVLLLALTLVTGLLAPSALAAPRGELAVPALGRTGLIVPADREVPNTAPADLTTGTVVTARAHARRLAVGDSLLVGIRTQLKHRRFRVNARVGRQFSAAPAILRSYGHRLPRNVVIELGTNGTLTLALCKKVVRIAGKHRRVFLVNNRVPRSWQAGNNRTLRRCDHSFAAKRVRLVNWYKASAGHPEYVADDGVHHTAKGRRAFARVIDHAVDRHGI